MSVKIKELLYELDKIPTSKKFSKQKQISRLLKRKALNVGINKFTNKIVIGVQMGNIRDIREFELDQILKNPQLLMQNLSKDKPIKILQILANYFVCVKLLNS